MPEKNSLIVVLEILKSGYWYDKNVRTVLMPFGISHEQFNVLRILEHHYPRKFSLKELQARLMNQTANTTRLVEKLKQKGLITSEYSRTDRRLLQIGITEAGLEVLSEIQEPLFKLSEQVNKNLSEEDRTSLIRILRNMRTVG